MKITGPEREAIDFTREIRNSPADEPQPVEPLLIRQTDWFRPRAHLAPKRDQENPLRPKPSNS
jgi:hypothetical protein